jgi:hypothetical protein
VRQTKLESAIEQVINVGSGFLLSLFLWQCVIAPLYGIPVTLASNLGITTLFTVVSVARGYVWRRFFNAGLHRAVHNFVRRTYGK